MEIDPRYFRPAEVDLLLGDSTKAKQKLGWQPQLSFKGLVELMVDADLEVLGLATPKGVASGDVATFRKPNQTSALD